MNPVTLQGVANIILVLGIIFTAIGTGGSYYFGKKVDEKKEQAASAKQDKLISQNQDLLRKIEAYQQDLLKKDEKIKELDKQAKMATRGITSIYGFKGERRETASGKISLVVGAEVEVFNRMVELEKSKNYTELIRLCEYQIAKTPDWFTPHLYLAVGYANTGKKDEAIGKLRYVIDNTPGDPAYAEAEVLLRKLESSPKSE